MLGRRGLLKFVAGPPFVVLAAFFLVPLVLIAAFSFREGSGVLGPSDPWAPTTEHYAEVLTTPAFMRLLGFSVLTAAIIAGLATVLAYPVAYFLTFRAGRRAPLYLILLLIPFAVSYLLRVMAWKLMLGPEGGINSLLAAIGLTDEPLQLLLYSRPAVVITLVYIWIPFAALPIYAAMQRIERHQLEAAADLGAGPWARFWRVTVPLSLPGALATFFLVFIPTVGEYVTPDLVGGTDGIMYGNIIQGFFTRSANWPLGSAMAMIMLVLTLRGRRRRAADHQRAAARGMIGIGRTRVPLRGFFVAMLVLLYLPIGLLFVFSFNAATTLSFPLSGFTTEWYASVIGNGPMLAAARNSLVVAIASATLATTIGALVALAVLRFSFRGRGLLLAMAGLPLLVPYVVLGVAFFLLFVTLDIPSLAPDGDDRPHGRRRPVRDAHPPGAPLRPRPRARGRGDGPRRELPHGRSPRGAAAHGPDRARRVADVLHRQLRRDRAGHLPRGRRPDLPGLPLRAAAVRPAPAGPDRRSRAADARHDRTDRVHHPPAGPPLQLTGGQRL